MAPTTATQRPNYDGDNICYLASARAVAHTALPLKDISVYVAKRVKRTETPSLPRQPHPCSPHFLMLHAIQESGACCQAGRASVAEKATGRKLERTRLMSAPAYFWARQGTKGPVYLAVVRKQAESRAGGFSGDLADFPTLPGRKQPMTAAPPRGPRSPVRGAMELRGRKSVKSVRADVMTLLCTGFCLHHVVVLIKALPAQEKERVE
ncbi:hypothetical protein SRHO_G00231490 [Serrasalmus rhombeus]